MTTRMNFKPRKDQRGKDAEARQEAYNKLGTGSKILKAGEKEKKKLLAKGE